VTRQSLVVRIRGLQFDHDDYSSGFPGLSVQVRYNYKEWEMYGVMPDFYCKLSEGHYKAKRGKADFSQVLLEMWAQQ
jgi:hypothetical protein